VTFEVSARYCSQTARPIYETVTNVAIND